MVLLSSSDKDDLGYRDNVTSVNDEVFSSHATESTSGLQELKPEWKVVFVHS